MSGPEDSSRRIEFLYEYARASTELVTLVEGFRAMKQPRVIGFPEGLRLVTHEMRELRKNFPDGMFSILEWLMNRTSFPKEPWTKQGSALGGLGVDGGPAVRCCPGAKPANSERETNSKAFKSVGQQVLHRPGIAYQHEISYKAAPYESVYALVVDWRQPDAEIWQALRRTIRRPHEFTALAVINPEQRALWTLTDKLPFTPDAALGWLETLRRFNQCGESWPAFLEQHDARIKKRMEKGSVSYESWRRKHQRECEHARVVLRWLEDGGQRQLTRRDIR